MDHALGLHDPEIVYQGPVGFKCLGPDARSPSLDVSPLDLGDEPLEGPDKGALEVRAVHLAQSHLHELDDHDQKSLVGEGLPGVAQCKAEFLIPFPLEGQDRVGTGLHTARDHAGKVDPQEGEGRVRNRIEQVPYQVFLLGLEGVVLSPEGDDLELGVYPAEAGHPVRLQAGAVDEVAACEGPGAGLQHQPAPILPAGSHPGVQPDISPPRLQVLGERFGHPDIVHDPGVRHQQPVDAGGMRLVFPDLLGAQAPEPLQPVGTAPFLQFVEVWDLLLPGRHHHLAAAFAGDAVLLTEGVHGLAACHTVPGLERVGLVVEPRVDHPAVVAGLVGRQPVFRLQDEDGEVTGPGQSHAGGTADDAAADDRDVVSFPFHGNLRLYAHSDINSTISADPICH